MTTAVAAERVLVRELGEDAHVVACLEGASVVWLQGGLGMTGWGVYDRLEITGEDHFGQARQWAGKLSQRLDCRQGSPVVFASFAFDQRRDSSVVVVPQVVLRRDAQGTSLITIGAAGLPEPTSQARPQARVVLHHPGGLSDQQWMSRVKLALGRIEAGQVSKVVLAREVLVRTEAAIQVAPLVQQLAQRNPQCATFLLDGWVGASPEMLVRLAQGRVSSRVLAGTAPLHPGGLQAAKQQLLASDKDRREHDFSVHDVLASLQPLCEQAPVAGPAHLLELPTVVHWASDVQGRVKPGVDALQVVQALHPTAAICGTPRQQALELIGEIESLRRQRYTGPVGWFNAAGEGEFAIALRCAQLTEGGTGLRVFAGAGIVAGSDPATELAETQAKMLPLLDALVPAPTP